jgi:hypothetical protein
MSRNDQEKFNRETRIALLKRLVIIIREFINLFPLPKTQELLKEPLMTGVKLVTKTRIESQPSKLLGEYSVKEIKVPLDGVNKNEGEKQNVFINPQPLPPALVSDQEFEKIQTT